VITGVRRCGKSTLMKQYMERLRAAGTDEGRIMYMNMESRESEGIGDFRELGDRIEARLPRDGRSYIFPDEVQRVPEWERTVNSLMVDHDADICITGSNAKLLSSELSTYLSGRYIEIAMLPLSFKEYMFLHPTAGNHSIRSRFTDYMWMGSMPMIDPEFGDDLNNDILIGYTTR
jgi:predicted AAA+ superfamily ATPase